MTFNETAINSIYDKVLSHAMSLGYFETVNGHEPKNAPTNGVTAAVWFQALTPLKSSGLAATSGLVLLNVRLYTSFLQQPFDSIDPAMVAAAAALLNAYSGDFDFGATVREVDLLGAYGTGMNAVAGYVQIDNKIYRIITINVPIVVNDMFTQAG